MKAAIAEPAPDATALTVTADQLDLIRRTIANGATPDELKLYLYDCARQGVHPLDKLIHFTKRGGKYTPVTSIDFMRIRAAESGEYAGSDDATFDTELLANGAPDHTKPPRAAQVTVWRLVQLTRCAFTATARWSEYKPDANDFMWKKMPHTMLAKCAEALALRKGFPRQLAGLYAKEEMDQADTHVVTSPASRRPAFTPVSGEREKPSAPNGGVIGHVNPQTGEELPPGYHYINHYNFERGWHEIEILDFDGKGGSMKFSTKLPSVGNIAKQAYEDRQPVRVDWKPKPNDRFGGGYLNAVDVLLPEIQLREEHTAPVTDADCPF